MSQHKFIEITVKNHMISHGFNEENQEIIEQVTVDTSSKKLLAVNRIQSISEQYILTTYSSGRLIYWEYEESYEDLKAELMGIGND